MPNAEPSDMGARPAVLTRGPLWFVAALPPPLNGQSNCNEAMKAVLDDRICVVQIDLGRTALGKLWRMLANTFLLAVRAQSGGVVYISIPGQKGSWLLLPTVIVLRMSGTAVWFHHHSFRPISRGPLLAIRALVASAGPRQHHILLSDGMRGRFATIYLRDCGGAAHTLSNTVLFPPDCGSAILPRPERPLTLGHVSVLTREKGVFYLLELFEALRADVPDLRLVIAGPSDDADLLNALHEELARHRGAIEYRGAVAGEDKARFYRDIDVFVLPTTLVDEAEPLVMMEAYEKGVEVLATPTGCIPERIRMRESLLTLKLADDAALIASLARQTKEGWAARRQACRAHVCDLAQATQEQGRAVLDCLLEPFSAVRPHRDRVIEPAPR